MLVCWSAGLMDAAGVAQACATLFRLNGVKLLSHSLCTSLPQQHLLRPAIFFHMASAQKHCLSIYYQASIACHLIPRQQSQY